MNVSKYNLMQFNNKKLLLALSYLTDDILVTHLVTYRPFFIHDNTVTGL